MSNGSERDLYYYEPPKTFSKSAARSIAVLEFFSRTRRPARGAEISEALGLPASSTKYLLQSLTESGYLTFDPKRKTYFPSIQLLGFASWLSEIYPDGEHLRAMTQEVHNRTGEIASIMVQHGRHMRVLLLAGVEGLLKPPGYDFRFRVSMVGTASGGAALATLSEEEVVDIVDWESRRLPLEQRQENRDQVLARIRQFRKQGYAVNFGDLAAENLGVAVPLPVHNDYTPPLVLGVFGPLEKLADREGEMARLLKEIAHCP